MSEQDDIYEALRAAVKALGGAKRIGHAMRPEKTLDAAQGWLLDCLNPARNEKLDPEQVVWLLREAKAAGHHDAMAFVATSAGYSIPTPVCPVEEAADLQRQFIDAVARQEKLFAQMRAAGVNVDA